MKNTYRLVVFDWEGTLADSLGQILKAITLQAKESGFGEVDLELARRVIVLGPVVALKKLFPHLSAHQLSELLQAAQKKMLMSSDDIYMTTGAFEVLNQLKQAGFQLAIATNKGQQSLNRDLIASGFDSLIETTRSASHAPAKPCPQMLEEIMDECGVCAEETLMVGDSVSDIEMAVQIGVKAVGVDLYHQNESSLRAAGADAVIDNFFQLLDYLSLKKMSD